MTITIMPTHIVCVHSHLFLTLHRGNQITIETESERERDCTQRLIKDKYTLFISIRATLLQRYLSAYNKDVECNKVATPKSVQSRIANILCVMCYWRTTKINNRKFCRLAFARLLIHANRNTLEAITILLQAFKKPSISCILV